MPPFHQASSCQYFSDDDTDNESTFSVRDKDEEDELKIKATVRVVRFAEDRNVVHVYPGVPTKDYDRVWYTQEEEDAFLQNSLVLSCNSFRCNQVDSIVDDGSQVLSTALLLGSLVMQGVVLRAVLLGHEISSQLI